MKILFATVKDAENAEISDKKYLQLFGIQKDSMKASELLKFIFNRVRENISKESQSVLEKILSRGTLASALVKKLGANPSRENFILEYSKLAKCLSENSLYE